ncbi:hypothetical protein BKA70DRAFT_53001 [Coprinopsis sp. MPI-PUGE-AT-0042]|nr:hypothetical protein BKA70DRAFT_53001 [Coprinopsis sp. MPI-PUGE-AT-0042]
MLFALSTLVMSYASALVIPRQLNSTCSAPSVQLAMASCLNFPAIPAILNTPAENTFLDPMESWLSGFCAPNTPVCSDETLAALVNDMTNHCFDFLPAVGSINEILAANTGSPGSVFPFPFSLLDPAPTRRSTEETISLVQKFYPTLRKIMCFKDKGELCLTKTTLKGVESHVGTFNQNNLAATNVFNPGVTDFSTLD